MSTSVETIANLIADKDSACKSVCSMPQGSPRMKSKVNQAKYSMWTPVSALPVLIISVFIADCLLLGSSGEARLGFLKNMLCDRLWKFSLLGNSLVLDSFLSAGLAGIIVLQLMRSARWGKHHTEAKCTAGRMSVPSRRDAKPHSLCAQPSGTPTDRALPSIRWNHAIDSAARQGDSQKATQLLLQFEREKNDQVGHKPDALSYNLVIRAYAKQGDVKGAERWLTRMVSCGVEATVCSYNTVLDACAKAGSAEACEYWLQRMLDKRVEANVISYATVIYARARRGEEDLAEACFDKMLAAGIEPDAVCYNSMIHACGVGGNAAGAERWMKAMQSRGLTASVTTLTAVIDACAKSGDVARAEEWLETMISSTVQPNVMSFSAMIDACAKAANPSRAEYWHTRMVQCGITPNAHSYSAVINACAKVGDVAMAEEWLGRSEQAGIANDVVVYSSVIDACGKAGDADRAMVIFRRMQAHGIKPHIVACAALARPFAYRGDWVEVERIAKEMSSVGIAPNEYFVYAQLLSYATARPRQSQRAEQYFRTVHRLGMKVNDHVVSALSRAVGRQQCTALMNDLCQGRPVPVPKPRRDGAQQKQ